MRRLVYLSIAVSWRHAVFVLNARHLSGRENYAMVLTGRCSGYDKEIDTGLEVNSASAPRNGAAKRHFFEHDQRIGTRATASFCSFEVVPPRAGLAANAQLPMRSIHAQEGALVPRWNHYYYHAGTLSLSPLPIDLNSIQRNYARQNALSLCPAPHTLRTHDRRSPNPTA